MADTPDPKSPAPSRKVIFLRRLLSSVILWAVVIASLFSGNKLLSDYVFLAIMMTLAWAGLVEFYNLLEHKNTFCFKWFGVFSGLLLMVSTFFYVTGRWGTASRPSDVNNFETTFLILFVLGLCVRQFVSKTSTAGLIAISTTLFGLMYVPYLLNFVQKINYFPHLDGNGAYYILYFILVTKFSDLGAYVTGSLIGKHKMIPRISPGKTWEGFGGAIVISTAVSMTFAHFAAHKLVGMTLLHAAILGVILSLSAVVGDLIESIFKREAGVKDSGTFFPGIGGILDLIDSILFNAPIMYLYLRHILT
jgi:phosphatidate cytidylyltransferase